MTRRAVTESLRVSGDTWIEATPAERAMASLDMALPAMTPPADLWAGIDQALSGAQMISVAGIDIERFAQGAWRKLAPGVRMKRLWGKRTFLIECQPGSVVPAHRHRTFEHSLILSGDVTSAEGDYGPGDYHGMPAGSRHAAWSTRSGCQVLIQHDA